MSAICPNLGANGRMIKVALSADNPAPLLVTVNGKELVSLGVAIQVQASQGVAAQFQNSFNGNIYVIPFGDSPGEVRITFIMNKICDSTQNSNSTAAFEYYLKQRLSPSNTKPGTVVIGSVALTSFVIGFSLSAQAQESTMVTGTLVLRAWPGNT
jgi:hypothetical protein